MGGHWGKPRMDGFDGGLYEVRTKHDRKTYRVLFAFSDNTMILLHGLLKETPKRRRQA